MQPRLAAPCRNVSESTDQLGRSCELLMGLLQIPRCTTCCTRPRLGRTKRLPASSAGGTVDAQSVMPQSVHIGLVEPSELLVQFQGSFACGPFVSLRD